MVELDFTGLFTSCEALGKLLNLSVPQPSKICKMGVTLLGCCRDQVKSSNT